jgi:hypothetical protein
MSLDFYLEAVRPTEVYWRNITHNLGAMAREAGIYDCLWQPDEHGMTKAAQIIAPLEAGIALMVSDPERFKKHNPANGWGDYDSLLSFARNTLVACGENPDADVRISR